MSKQIQVVQNFRATLQPPTPPSDQMHWSDIDFAKIESGSYSVAVTHCEITKFDQQILLAVNGGTNTALVFINTQSDSFTAVLGLLVINDALSYIQNGVLIQVNFNAGWAPSIGDKILINRPMQLLGFPAEFVRTADPNWNRIIFSTGGTENANFPTVNICPGVLFPATVYIVLGDTFSESHPSSQISNRVIAALESSPDNACHMVMKNMPMNPAFCTLRQENVLVSYVSSINIGFWSSVSEAYLNQFNYPSDLGQLSITLEFTKN